MARIIIQLVKIFEQQLAFKKLKQTKALASYRK